MNKKPKKLKKHKIFSRKQKAIRKESSSKIFFTGKSPNLKKKKNRVGLKTIARKSSKILKYVTILLFSVLFALLIYVFRDRLEIGEHLKVRTVSISGAVSYVNYDDFKEVAENRLLDKSIYSIDLQNVENDLLEVFQGAKDIKLNKLYPNTISIFVSERIPLALVFNDTLEENQLFLIDEDGYVLGIVADGTTNLPRIRYDEEIGVGTFIDKDLIPVYFELISVLDKEKIEASSISVNKSSVGLFLYDETEVHMKRDSNKQEEIKLLKSLLEMLRTEGKNPKKVDLRYEKVIVSYE